MTVGKVEVGSQIPRVEWNQTEAREFASLPECSPMITITKKLLPQGREAKSSEGPRRVSDAGTVGLKQPKACVP